MPQITRPPKRGLTSLSNEYFAANTRVRELVELCEAQDRDFTNAELCEYSQNLARMREREDEIERDYPNYVWR